MAKKAASPKTKKPAVKSLPNTDDPIFKENGATWWWTDFEDWKITNNNFPHINVRESENIGDAEREIVSDNIELLGEREKWDRKIFGLNALLEKHSKDEVQREEKRAEYAIRFDGADFSNIFKIKGFLNFEDMTFPCAVSFNDVNFEKISAFRGAEFLGDVNFHRTNFNHHNVSFNECLFRGRVNFYKATSNSHFNFYGTKFENHAQFNDVIMNGNMEFTRSTFEKNLYFKNRGEIHNMPAKDMVVKGNLIVGSKFRSADFQGFSVAGTADFSGSEFKNVPDFRDSKLNRPPEVAGMIVPPPKMYPFKWFNFTESEDKSDVAKYRKLKAMALAANDHEKDGEFFSYEMMAKRGHETTGFFRLLLNSLYWLLSFYGQSIARPFWAMIVSFFTFWASGLAMIKVMTGSLQEFWFAGVHSALNLVPLIGALFRATSTPEGHTSWYDATYHQLVDNGLSTDGWAALSALQQIIGAVLFFLLFLGLRNKFRLK